MAGDARVPILSAGGVVAGAFHLTDKEGGPEFSDDDQRLIETFAAHATLENARLHERSRELSIVGAVERGEALLHPAVAARVLQEIVSPDGAPARAQRHESLTEREREVLALLARGRANKATAFELGCAETVKTHVGTSSPSSACRIARRRRCTRCERG